MGRQIPDAERRAMVSWRLYSPRERALIDRAVALNRARVDGKRKSAAAYTRRAAILQACRDTGEDPADYGLGKKNKV